MSKLLLGPNRPFALPSGRKDGRKAAGMYGPELARVVTGEDDLSEWSDEELERGQRRKDGRWPPGRLPPAFPRQLVEEYSRRVKTRIAQRIAKASIPAVETLVEIAEGFFDSPAEARERRGAANDLLDRFLGKPTEHVEQTLTIAPWQEALEEAIEADWGFGPVVDVAEAWTGDPLEDPTPWEEEEDAMPWDGWDESEGEPTYQEPGNGPQDTAGSREPPLPAYDGPGDGDRYGVFTPWPPGSLPPPSHGGPAVGWR